MCTQKRANHDLLVICILLLKGTACRQTTPSLIASFMPSFNTFLLSGTTAKHWAKSMIHYSTLGSNSVTATLFFSSLEADSRDVLSHLYVWEMERGRPANSYTLRKTVKEVTLFQCASARLQLQQLGS